MNDVKLEVTSKRRNELLKRVEVEFQVGHEGEGTPSRIEVRKNLASILDVDEEKVYVKKIETKTGMNLSIGKANIYDSPSQAMYVEPEHIILRNKPKTKEEGGE